MVPVLRQCGPFEGLFGMLDMAQWHLVCGSNRSQENEKVETLPANEDGKHVEFWTCKTLPETNITPARKPSQKETCLPIIHFQVPYGAMLYGFREGTGYLPKSL